MAVIVELDDGTGPAIRHTFFSGHHTIGRADDCDIRPVDRRVSRLHAVIDADTCRYRDLGSQGGSWVDGVRHEEVAIGTTTVVSIALGGPHSPVTLRCSVAPEETATRIAASTPQAPVTPMTELREATAPLHTHAVHGSIRGAGTYVVLSPDHATRIGRAPDCEVVVPELVVSRYHAEIRSRDRGFELVDLDSHNGTYADGRIVSEPLPLRDGTRITVGTATFVMQIVPDNHDANLPTHTEVGARPDDRQAAERPATASGTGIDARDLSVALASGERVLDRVDVRVEPGQFVAIVGPTGAGKSTLLKVLTGAQPPTEGTVLINGTDLYEQFEALRLQIGYVPQEDILHTELSARTALRFAAELRFTPDTSPAERNDRVEEVITELGLTARADVAIAKLSGGQRKRTNVALELLTKPALLFLDEPTSGLDPGYEQAVMELLRELADHGRAVVVVTHSLASLALCDEVIFLATGGRLAFRGAPLEALTFFGATDFPSVFRTLESYTPQLATREPTSTVPERSPVLAPIAPSVPWKTQWSMVMRRHLALLLADRRNLFVLCGAPLVPALLVLSLIGAGALDPSAPLPRVDARMIIGALVITAAALGAANGVREVIKELPIYLRERSVGLERSAYLLGKLCVLGLITSAQCAVLVIIGTAKAGGPSTSNVLGGHTELIIDVALCGVASVAFGLAISTLVNSSDKAMALIPVVFVISWLFSGVAVDLTTKPILRPIAYTIPANWGVAASASTVDLPLLARCATPANSASTSTAGTSPAAQGPAASNALNCDSRWRHDITYWFLDSLVLAMLVAVLVVIADWGLARKEPLESEMRNTWIRRGWDAVRMQLRRNPG